MVEDELNSDSEEEEAKVDSGKNDVKETLETVKEQIHQDVEDDADLSLRPAAAGSAGHYLVDQATCQYYFQSSNGDMVQLVDADTGVGGGGILDNVVNVVMNLLYIININM